jgi:hypothetical protein
LASSLAFSAFIAGSVSQPLVSISSAKLSRVPLVGGGPMTRIFSAGSDGFTSFQVCALFGPRP